MSELHCACCGRPIAPGRARLVGDDIVNDGCATVCGVACAERFDARAWRRSGLGRGLGWWLSRPAEAP